MFQRRAVLAALGAASLAPLAQQVHAATFPLSRPSRILVGFTPGGSADLMARALAPQLGAYAGSLIVENKPGAGGRMALDTAKAADPDGSTVVVTPSGMVTVYPHIYRKLGYDPLKDFVPVATIASFPFVLVVGSAVPAEVKTVKDLVAWARANPDKGAYASPGNGSAPHFGGVALARAATVDLTHIPYKGGAPAMNDTIGGQVALNIAVISNALPVIQAGKVRALAVTGAQRSRALPNVPTVQEAGYPELQMTESFYVLLPSRTPPEVVRKLHAEVYRATAARAFQEVLANAAFDGMPPQSLEQVAKDYREDYDRWAGIVKASGFTPED